MSTATRMADASLLRLMPVDLFTAQRLVRLCLIFLVVLSAQDAHDHASDTNEENDHGHLSESAASVGTLKAENPAPTFLKGEYGVLEASSLLVPSSESEDFCIIHFNGDHLPDARNESHYHPLVNFTNYPSVLFCPGGSPVDVPNNSLILIKYDVSACNISTQAAFLESRGAYGLLVELSRSTSVNKVEISPNATLDPAFLVAVISEKSVSIIAHIFNETKTKDPVVLMRVFSPQHQKRDSGYPFDFSLIVIWFIAVFTVTVGSFWSGHVRAALFFKRKYELPDRAESEESRS